MQKNIPSITGGPRIKTFPVRIDVDKAFENAAAEGLLVDV